MLSPAYLTEEQFGWESNCIIGRKSHFQFFFLIPMTWWESVILGLIQGLTEFLPISSSGHLVLGQYVLGLEPGGNGVLFEVLVHFGTVMSIAYVYRARLGTLILDVVKGIVRPNQWVDGYRNQANFRLGMHVLSP